MKHWMKKIEQMFFREKLLKDQYNRIIDNRKLQSNPIYDCCRGPTAAGGHQPHCPELNEEIRIK